MLMKTAMANKIRYIVLIVSLTAYLSSTAQNSQVLYNMNLPQKHLLNPAMVPTNSVYIGLPALSGVNVNINNNFFNFSDVIMKGGQGDSLITILDPGYDTGDFLKKIKDRNSLEPQALVQLFGLGFRAGGDMYFFLDINERVEGNIVLPGDILRLALEGNEQFVGNKIDLSSLRGDFRYFRETGFGFSKNFTEKLRIGVKGKLLQGVGAFSIDNNQLGVTVNDDYSHTFNADLSVNMSAPAKVFLNSENMIDSIQFDDGRFDNGGNIVRYLLNTGNTGFGIDIGAEYALLSNLTLSASVTDLGYIKWKRDVTNLKAESSFHFSGIDMLDVYNEEISIDSLATELLDSLKNSFRVIDSGDPFTTYLPVGLTLAGRYDVTDKFSLGLVSYTRFIGGQVREALTVSANLNLGNAFSTTLAYTAANHRYDNLGAGIAFRAGVIQFYLLADRIPVSWNKLVFDDGSVILPVSWNTVHARFGMNLVFGNKVKKKNDKPMVIVE